MPASTKRSPLVRRTFITVSFLALVALFFALNYLLFIPKQQQLYNTKVFRTLHEISDDFKRSLNGRAEYYERNLKWDSAGGKIDVPRDISQVKFQSLLDASFLVRTKTAIDSEQR